MATQDWPTSKHFRLGVPHGFGISSPQGAWRGMYTGNTEGTKRLSDRYVMRAVLAACTKDEAAEREAFFGGLVSTGDWVRLGLPQRDAQPRGTLGGTVTVGSSAAALVRSIALAGALSRPNLLFNGTGLDLSPWTTNGVTVAANFYTDPLGTGTAEKLTSNSAGNDYVYQAVTLVVGRRYTFSAYLANNTASQSALMVRQSLSSAETSITWSGGTVSSASLASGVNVGYANQGTYWRVWITFDAVESNTWVRVYPDGTNAGANIACWGVQLEEGSAPTAYAGAPTLLAGDVLAVGGNLLQVAYGGATGTEAGVFSSVPLVLPTQEALSSGAGVTWDRPTGTWELDRGDSISFDYSAASLQQPVSIPLRQRIV